MNECLEWAHPLISPELFVFGMMNEEGGACERRQGGHDDDADILVPPDDHDRGKDDQHGQPDEHDWAGREFGLTKDEFKDVKAWQANSQGFAGQIHDEQSRMRLLLDVECEGIAPVVFAGYLLSMGLSMERVADFFLRDPDGGKYLRGAVEERCVQFQKKLERQAEEKREKLALPFGGDRSTLPVVGFYRDIVPGEQPFDVDMAGTRTSVDLADLAHVAPAVPNTAEDRRRARERDLVQPKTSGILSLYYEEVEKHTRFNPVTLATIKCRAGDALLKGAAVPLPRNITPGAVVEEVKHEFLIGQRSLSASERTREAQIRNEQKMMRNIVCRFLAPLHCKLATAADACSDDELLTVALEAWSEEDESTRETIARISKDQLLEGVLGCFSSALQEMADDCGLLLHATCAKDVTLQKESLILNEDGTRHAVQELYGDLPRARQTATVSEEQRRKLDAGAQNSALLTAAVKGALEAGRKRKDHDHRTPSSGRKTYGGSRFGVPQAPRKSFRQPDWNNQHHGGAASVERSDARTQPYHPQFQGRGGRGAGRGRGNGPGARGRGSPSRGGPPVRR